MTTSITRTTSLTTAARTWGAARGIVGRTGGYLNAATLSQYDALPTAVRALPRAGAAENMRKAARQFGIWDAMRGGCVQGWDSLGRILVRIGEIVVEHDARGRAVYVTSTPDVETTEPVAETEIDEPAPAPAPAEPGTLRRIDVAFHQLADGDRIVAIDGRKLPVVQHVEGNLRRDEDGAAYLRKPRAGSEIEWVIYPRQGTVWTVERPSTAQDRATALAFDIDEVRSERAHPDNSAADRAAIGQVEARLVAAFRDADRPGPRPSLTDLFRRLDGTSMALLCGQDVRGEHPAAFTAFAQRIAEIAQAHPEISRRIAERARVRDELAEAAEYATEAAGLRVR